VEFPTNFTPRQLEILQRLVREKNQTQTGRPNVEMTSLQYKLDDYWRNAEAAKRLRAAASAGLSGQNLR
jgi:hypothetical protein